MPTAPGAGWEEGAGGGPGLSGPAAAARASSVRIFATRAGVSAASPRAVASFADDLDATPGEEALETLADQPVIVHQRDS